MVVEIKKEIITSIFLILCGMFSGVIYDLFKSLEDKNTKPFFAFIKETFYFLLIGVITFNVIRFVNDGSYRTYEFVFLFTGIFLYKMFFSRFVFKFFCFILKIVKIIVNKVLFVAFFPIKRIYRLIKGIFRNKESKIYKKILKNRLTIKEFCFKIKPSVGKIFRIGKNK